MKKNNRSKRNGLGKKWSPYKMAVVQAHSELERMQREGYLGFNFIHRRINELAYEFGNI